MFARVLLLAAVTAIVCVPEAFVVTPAGTAADSPWTPADWQYRLPVVLEEPGIDDHQRAIARVRADFGGRAHWFSTVPRCHQNPGPQPLPPQTSVQTVPRATSRELISGGGGR